MRAPLKQEVILTKGDDESGSGSDNKLSHSGLNSSVSHTQGYSKLKQLGAGTGGGNSSEGSGGLYKNDEDCNGGNKKKRGRRKLEDEQYYAISNDKIQEWEHELQTSKTLSKKEKKILRNRISAQKSRNKKKEEFTILNTQIEILTKKYQELYDVMDNTLCTSCKDNLANNLAVASLKRQKTEERKEMSSTTSMPK